MRWSLRLLTRRALLARAWKTAAIWGLVAAAPVVGCGSDRSGRRVVELLRQRFDAEPGVQSVADTVWWPREEALQVLRRDLPEERWREVSSSAAALQQFVEERRSDDLAEGRKRYVNGWLLAETEIAVAVLASP